MTTAAIIGLGTVFKRGDSASAETFTAIGEIRSISGLNPSRGEVDVTTIDTVGGYMDTKPILRDPGTLTVGANFVFADFLLFNADFAVDTSRNYQIVFTDTGNTTVEFAAYVNGMNITGITPQEAVGVEYTVRITGAPTWTS